MHRHQFVFKSFAILVLISSWAVLLASADPARSEQAKTAHGESRTLLPSGQFLVVGGQDKDGKVVRDAAIIDIVTGVSTPLSTTLNVARTWHTATVLPDGTVFIFGGIGTDGRVVAQAEIFDPPTRTFQLLASSPTPRAFHSATLLTDGRLFIAGGTSVSGTVLRNVELWNPRTKASMTPQTLLTTPRRNHLAQLLADGRVLLQGGKDENSNSLTTADVYDPGSQAVSRMVGQQVVTEGGLTEARATSPEDDALDIPLDAVIALRFSEPLVIQTINSQNAILSGPAGAVQAKVVGTEGGMLAFITPASNLLPGTVYSVTFSGAVDLNNSTVAPKEFTFTTAGEPSGDDDEWSPNGDWQTHRGPSKWQSLPPLQAAPGVTALAGQVLKLNGDPLRRVTLTIDERRTFTDGTGRFLLQNLKSGHHSLMVIASTANTAQRQYGIYEVGVDIKPGVTNVLSYTIWQTPLDTAHTVSIPSPTLSEDVIRSPLLPGLELHIPANTVITGYDGKVVTQINITPIPLDRPPFPLPNVQVPIYFTIQPGSAYINVINASGPKGARLFYPNAYNYPPRTVYSFWNYDPDKKGWFVYGNGKVSADRSQVIPDPGVAIYEFTGAMVSNVANAPTTWPRPMNNSTGGDPVDLGTGLFVYTKTDLALQDVTSIALTRTYRQNDPVSRAFGVGTSDPYDMFLIGPNDVNNPGVGYIWADLVLSDGGRVHFQRTSACTGANGYCDYPNAVYQATSTPTDFFGATFKWASCPVVGGQWTMTKKDGTTICFISSDGSNNARMAAPWGIIDRYGNAVILKHDQYNNYNLTQITSQNGRWIQLTYDSNNRVTQAKDSIGRTVGYSYDSGGRLIQVTDANSGVWNYTYDVNGDMLSIQDPRGIFYLSNQYDANGRVIQQTEADNTNFYFSYTTDQNNNVTQTDMTDPRGVVRRTTYNANGYKATEILALGTPEQQTIAYNRDLNTNLLNSVVDALNRESDYTYDAYGNLTGITRLAHTSNAVATTLTYEPTFNLLASVKDPLNHTISLQHDSVGNVISITDPLSHQQTFTYDSSGQVLTATDALQNTTTFSYDRGDLVGITDPLQNTTTRFIDNAGRVIKITNALGRSTSLVYNPLNQMLQITDPLQGVTSFTYDLNGNLLTVQDARQGTTSYTHNNHDLVATRTDPLQRQESYTYDANENLATFTDRKGQVTTYTYDNLNRLNFVGFGTQGNTYASTISYHYDAGNRMTQATDSISGIITRGFDGLNRLMSETTPQGSISYTYDNASRRATMQVVGQSQVGYTFDNANRLTQIAQGTSTVGFTYDNANRRSTLTLPNGIVATYSYDNDSHLAGISYSLNSNSVGVLNYGYDALGLRNSVSGSFARTGLPQPIPSATYDSANELLTWNESALSYDTNGNMLNDGVHNYAWDARNHLSTIDSGSTGSFVYDPAGRRATKVISGSQTNFLYDLTNPVQELSGTTPTANLLTGGMDEYFARTDASGTSNFLTDALGSTATLTDPTGTAQTQYTFDPFGNTAQSGTSSTNSFTYTGREMDGTGLYFNRARYYNPQLGRFISEDPAGLLFGSNPYQYAYDSPTNYVDPNGLAPIDYILPDSLASHINWNYVPAVCNADSFRFYGGGGRSENIQGGAYNLDDVHYANNGGNWQVDGMESDTLYEASGEHWGGGAVMHGRKLKEALLFPPSPYHAKRTLALGPVKLRAEGGLGPLIGYSNDGISIGFYGDVGLGGGIGNYGGGGAIGGGWSVTFSSAASCVAQ